MRIVAIGLAHETNTFARTKTTLMDFVTYSGGDEQFPTDRLVEDYDGTDTILGGYLAGAAACGVTLDPVFHASAMSGGTVEQEAYETMKNLLLHRLEKALPCDGILLNLHGAMVSEEIEDVEGDLAAAVRMAAGSLPIIMTLDLHANITQAMAENTTAIIGYDTYPHCDSRERGIEAVELMVRALRGEVAPRMAYLQLPLLTLPPMQCTLRSPMTEIMSRLHDIEKDPKVLTMTLSGGFPFADIADAGMSVVAVTDGDAALAAKTARSFGEYVFSRRDDFEPVLTGTQQVIRYVREEAKGPVILADGSDNPGGGAPADGTVILEELIREDVSDTVIGVLCDPEAVEAAHRAGVGRMIAIRLGGKTDALHGRPLDVEAYVRLLSDGEFTYRGLMNHGVKGHFGRMAVLVAGGIEIVVAERRIQLLDREMLRCVGIEPALRKLIVVKSAVHFWADFMDIADRIFDADTPGIHRPDFSKYEYRKLRRPMYPLDRDVRGTFLTAAPGADHNSVIIT
ncbi:MAG: M81 family metallopeptidase [Spirochaetales bacterium]|nr:M81 family metallopeptidase [Spirochaetales bacterium]